MSLGVPIPQQRKAVISGMFTAADLSVLCISHKISPPHTRLLFFFFFFFCISQFVYFKSSFASFYFFFCCWQLLICVKKKEKLFPKCTWIGEVVHPHREERIFLSGCLFGADHPPMQLTQEDDCVKGDSTPTTAALQSDGSAGSPAKMCSECYVNQTFVHDDGTVNDHKPR